MTGWRKRTIMEMAREVKMPYDFMTGEPINIEKLKAFAALVRDELAAEQQLTQQQTARIVDLQTHIENLEGEN